MNNIIIPEPIIFDWDKGNRDKNFKKHGITNEEAEEVFLNQPLTYEDLKHSKLEKRFISLGETDTGKKIFMTFLTTYHPKDAISFTVRGNKTRLISIRLMNKKERQQYAENIQKNS